MKLKEPKGLKEYHLEVQQRIKIEKKREKLLTLQALIETYKEMNINPRDSEYLKQLCQKARSVQCQLQAMGGT